MAQQQGLILLQPYLTLEAQHCQRIPQVGTGIAECYEFTIPANGQSQFPAEPDGSGDLVFGMGKQDVRLFIGGTVLQMKQWCFDPGRTYFGVRFQPGKSLLPKELCIQDVVNADLELQPSVYGDGLAEKIAMADSLQARSQLFLQTYLQQFPELTDTRHNLERYVRRRIYETKGTIGIQNLAEETGYSACYLRRVFEQIHGISPKLFERFIRFQNMLYLMEQQEWQSQRMDALCFESGYYDQSHMMKDFKRFAGRTPEQYRKFRLQPEE